MANVLSNEKRQQVVALVAWLASASHRGGDRGAAGDRHWFFSKKMPDTVELEITCPPGFESAEAFRDQLAVALEERERQAEAELAQQGRRSLGRHGVLQQNPDARPRTGEPRRDRNPRVACRDKWKRIETLMQLLAFLRSYRVAWKAFRNGARDVVFPAGTYGMRVNLLVGCAPSG